MNKLDELWAAMDELHDVLSCAGIEPTDGDRLIFSILKAILEKRVLLVPVEPTDEMVQECSSVQLQKQAMNLLKKDYKAMTQAVDVDKLIEEITNE